eukprot:TRINITY_DN428_c0_g1_i1.p1 TRINITY_DN428_c0_g1~~TRINITY_DN428_c0_g1_i1.p1  ORF type:complete len:312 (-),score=63.61 TRINITY_DN428_c0_g1_i1:920-1855(-)
MGIILKGMNRIAALILFISVFFCLEKVALAEVRELKQSQEVEIPIAGNNKEFATYIIPEGTTHLNFDVSFEGKATCAGQMKASISLDGAIPEKDDQFEHISVINCGQTKAFSLPITMISEKCGSGKGRCLLTLVLTSDANSKSKVTVGPSDDNQRVGPPVKLGPITITQDRWEILVRVTPFAFQDPSLASSYRLYYTMKGLRPEDTNPSYEVFGFDTKGAVHIQVDKTGEMKFSATATIQHRESGETFSYDYVPTKIVIQRPPLQWYWYIVMLVSTFLLCGVGIIIRRHYLKKFAEQQRRLLELEEAKSTK